MTMNQSEDAQFHQLLDMVSNVLTLVPESDPLFRTDATHLYDTFLEHIPESVRSEYRCSVCNSFFDHYGGLVTIDPNNGALHAVLSRLQGIPPFFAEAMQGVITLVEAANITQIFATGDNILGRPTSGPWRHFSMSVPPSRIYQAILPVKEYVTEHSVNIRSVMNAIQKYNGEEVRQAIQILRTVPRGGKFIPQARWFFQLLNGPQQDCCQICHSVLPNQSKLARIYS